MLGHRLRIGGSWCTWPWMLVLARDARSRASTFRHAITIVSPLNDAQYDGISFRWDPTGGNAYDTPSSQRVAAASCA
jgi:hypothetical protein